MGDRVLNLERKIFTDESTIGELKWDDGTRECDTLEDSCRRDKNSDGKLQKVEKVYGATAIPAGRYEIKMQDSSHYKRKMPFLQNVPYFDGIMIHWGNWAKDTFGCILVGEKLPGQSNFVSASQKNYNELEPKILEVLAKGRLFINISGGLSV